PQTIEQLMGLTLFIVTLLEFGGLHESQKITRWTLAAAWVLVVYGLIRPWFPSWPALLSSSVQSLFFISCFPLILSRARDPELDRSRFMSDVILSALMVWALYSLRKDSVNWLNSHFGLRDWTW